MAQCPECGGRKFLTGLGCPRFRPVLLPCALCKSTGIVSKQLMKQRQIGQKLRRLRLAEGVGLRRAAEFLGIKAVTLSAFERGQWTNT